MKNGYKKWLGTALAAAAAMLFSASAALATHQDITLKDATGANVTGNSPYSPKQTCSGCHFDCDGNASNGISYCTTQKRACGSGSDLCSQDYGEGSVNVTKVQNYVDPITHKVVETTYKVLSFEHGVSVGKHFNQGRNEEYTETTREAYGDLLFTSSPGMFGKY